MSLDSNFLLDDDMTSSILQLSAVNIKCPIHQTLNKYYLKTENKFVCEYDGFDKDGPESFLHMPQILEIYREEIVFLQNNPHILQKSKIDELIPYFLSKLKKINIDSSKLSFEIENFKSNICEKIIFLLRANSNLFDIKDLLNEVRFGPDGKPDLKKIGMNEQKEHNLIFLAQFLIFRDTEKSLDNNLLETFTKFLENFQKKLVEIIFNSIEFVDLSYNPFQDEVSRVEKKSNTDKSHKDYLKSYIVPRKDYDAMIIKYEELLNNKDSEIANLNVSLKNEKNQNHELQLINKDLNEKLRFLTLTLTEQELSLKGRIKELEELLFNLGNENEDFKKNQLKKHYDEMTDLKAFYENQLIQMKENYNIQINKQKDEYEKIILKLKDEIKILHEHYKNMNLLVNSSIDDLNNKRVKELEEILTEERKKNNLLVNEYENKINELNIKLMDLPKFNENLQKRIFELETENKDLKNHINILNNEIENLKKLLKEKEIILIKLNEEDKVIRLKEKQTNEGLLVRLNELEKLNAKYQKELNEIEDYRKYFDSYFNTKRDYERNLIELENLKSKNAYLVKELEDVKFDYENIIRSLNTQLSELKEKYESLLSENVVLSQQLNDKSNKLQLIQKSLDNLNYKLKDYPVGTGLSNSMIEFNNNLINNSTVHSLGNKSFDFNYPLESPSKSTDLRALLATEEKKLKNLEADLILENKKVKELLEIQINLKNKITTLEEAIANLQEINSDLNHKLISLTTEKENVFASSNNNNNYQQLLERDVAIRELENKLISSNENLYETIKQRDCLKEKITELLERIKNFNNIVLNFGSDVRSQLFVSEVFSKDPLAISADIDFIENDMYSLLLLNRNNYSLLREWLLPFSRNSLELDLNPENNTNIKLKLLHKASLHGFSASQFIRNCHNIQNTVVVAQTSFGKLIGGFTALPWIAPDDGNPFYCIDNEKKSFIFSFDLKMKFTLKNPEFAILCSDNMGPVFGGGSDLEIVDECNENFNKFADIGHTYAKPDEITKEDFYGAENYNITDYEVYHVVL